MENREQLKKKTIGGMIWKFAERITAQLVSTLITIILARILLPEDYGAIAIVTVFINLCNLLVTNGLGSALVQKKNPDDLDFSTIFHSGIVLSIGLYGVLFAIAPYIAQYYSMPVLTAVLRVMGLRLIIAAINSVQHAYVSKSLQFKRFFWSTLTGTICSGIVGVALAQNGYGIWALVFQYLTNTTIDTVFLFITIKWKPKLMFSFGRLKGLLNFGGKIMIASLLNEFYNSARTLIIGKVYSSTDLSFYNKGRHYPNLLTTNIDSSMKSVLFPVISKVQDDKARVKSMLRRSIKTSSYFVFPLLLGFAMVAEQFVDIVLTEKWLPCVSYMKIFCVSLCLAPLSSANQQAIKALGRSDITMRQEIVKKVFGILVIFITTPISVMTVVYGTVVVEIWCFLVNIIPNKKLIEYSVFEQVRDIFPNLIIAVVMSVCVGLVGYISINQILLLSLKIIAGVGVYIIGSVITKNETFFYILKMIRREYGKRRVKKIKKDNQGG